MFLTTITAVALSQIYDLTKIQLSLIGGGFWGSDDWIITKDSRILLNGILGKYVQYNGYNKTLTIEPYDESDAQRWEFRFAPGRYEYICSKKYPDICATAFKGIGGWLVIGLPKGKGGKQWWGLRESQGNLFVTRV
ncbi:hypothetical protein C1646_661105 [Rhizophagus diaphanus]|nr:hypothetical protein C1646_661105 [Rhizophagus diaphanus] [Rhizophagus sp. MUCL 43196]